MIKFNKPIEGINSLDYIKDAFQKNHVSGDGFYSKSCSEWFKKKLNCISSLITHSCTGALEMSAILANLEIDDEVIMPSYTFCSTANAFALRGAKPVFVDIRDDTLNIDENLIYSALSSKTKAIVPVHYAGVGCKMDKILEIAKENNLLVIEDAAQGFCSYYKNRPLGTIGDMGCLSFHETKNIMSGEGGLFICNNIKFHERSEIIREKGTNRSKFYRGQIDKYTWVDIGSSFLPSDIISAYLYSLLEIFEQIQDRRIAIWEKYHHSFAFLEDNGILKRPFIPNECTNNAHMYYLRLNSLSERSSLIDYLKQNNIYASFHYVPLHNSPAGMKYCKTATKMNNTILVSETLVRLPLFYDLTNEDQEKIIKTIYKFFKM
jgi:dTDP-4-amino-4,6-dideoxygalactose transaminase